MPSTSKAQQAVMAVAEHAPEKLHKENRGLLNMSHQQLHDFASTPRKGLPEKKAKDRDTTSQWRKAYIERKSKK